MRLTESPISFESHPPIQSLGALLTAAARFDPHRVRESLDGIPEADFLVDQEPWKPDAMRLMVGFRAQILGCALLVHDTLPR
jgi:hypothetical protein